MIVFYTERIEGNSLFIEGDEMRHCVKTLRHKVGDVISVFEEEGNLYQVLIDEIGRNAVKATIEDKTAYTPPKHHITLAIAPTKSPDRIEWMLSKAVEIGVQSIVLLHTERTERSRYKLDRLKRLAFSAAKQSLNFKLPNITECEAVHTLVSNNRDYTDKFIAHCLNPEEHLLNQKLSPHTNSIILIGPEGDFTEEEISLVLKDGFKEISLGPSRLRTETAGIVALTLMNGMLQRL